MRILLPLCDREILATQNRLFRIPELFAEGFCDVDIVTNDAAVAEKIAAYWNGHKSVRVLTAAMDYLQLPTTFRDDLVKIYIEQIQDFVLPGTGLRFWKTTAFDDFRGHISQWTSRLSENAYDLVLYPLPSEDDPPPEKNDVFYSSVVFLAKERGIPIVGFQLFPIFSTPLFFLKTVDFLLLRSDFDRDYCRQRGIADDRIEVVSRFFDGYYFDTVEDSYRNLVLDPQMRKLLPDPDSLIITVINHAKYRQEIREMISVLRELTVPYVVVLLKRAYTIRDLSETDVLNGLIMDDLKRLPGKYFIAEDGSLVTLMMFSDVILSASYLIPLSFAEKYGKTSVVYNPVTVPLEHYRGVTFLTDRKKLRTAIEDAYQHKRQGHSLQDALKRLCGAGGLK